MRRVSDPAMLWRGVIAASLCSSLLFGCGDSAAPADPTAWAGGRWVAVQYGGQPLPFSDGTVYPYLRTDSIVVVVRASAAPPTASVVPSVVVVAAPPIGPSPSFCSELYARTTITASRLRTEPAGVTTAVGNCNASWVTFDLNRNGDTLTGFWFGRAVLFVKRS